MRNKTKKYYGGKRSVWKRDGNKCRYCGCPVVDDQTVKGFAGEVHHLNKDDSDNRMINKILLCKQCHSLLHKLSEEEYVASIEKIVSVKTEVISDRKTFAMIDMAEAGATLEELKAFSNYTATTICTQLAAMGISGYGKGDKEI